MVEMVNSRDAIGVLFVSAQSRQPVGVSASSLFSHASGTSL